MIPRTVRNNNPGDLEHCHGTDWVGQLAPSYMNPAQRSEPRFVVFSSPEFGFRALVLLLHNYQRLYECDSIGKIIARFAPAGENPTAAYVGEVAHECGADAFAPFDLTVRGNAFKLAKAITKFETGSWAPYWTDNELDMGIDFTGLYPVAQKVAA